MSDNIVLSGKIVDVLNQRIFPGRIEILNGRIKTVTETPVSESHYILPGLIDAHIHIESSMLIPTEFARAAVIHGSVATVSDPHEIANVLGMAGIDFMIENAHRTPFKFYWAAPSCVPATPFENSGSQISAQEIETLLARPDIVSLSEVMNIPDVLNNVPEIHRKLSLAKTAGKIIDGHAPGLRGDDIARYVDAGITTDHECNTIEEAEEKLSLGMQIQIREGSAARNLDDLIPLLQNNYKSCMLCSDDKHPDDLAEGHINEMVKRAIAAGVDPLKVLWSASVTPVKTYGLDVGLLQPGDSADLIVVDDLENFKIKASYIEGVCVAENGSTILPSLPIEPINHFEALPQAPQSFRVKPKTETIPVIEVTDGLLVTKKTSWTPRLDDDGYILPDTSADILKITVLNRYILSQPAIAFIKNFGLQEGAIASSVAHDSHNIVAVGTSDEALAEVINIIIENQGGIATVADNGASQILPLPVAGIMSADSCTRVGRAYAEIDMQAKKLGSQLSAPFMTLSFMALLVIPEIKLSCKGLFDADKFEFMDVFAR